MLVQLTANHQPCGAEILRMKRVAIVTGANQGWGFAVAEGLARRLEPGDVVYLTGRRPGFRGGDGPSGSTSRPRWGRSPRCAYSRVSFPGVEGVPPFSAVDSARVGLTRR